MTAHWISTLRQWWSFLASPAPAREKTLTFETRLRSEVPEAYFTAVISVWWRRSGSHPVPDQAVLRLLAERADRISSSFSVLNPEILQASLELELPNIAFPGNVSISVETIEVRLHIPEGDLNLAEDHAEFLRKQSARQLRERHVMEGVAFLRSQVLNNAATARAWWLYQNPDKLSQLLEMHDKFELLSATVSLGAADQVARQVTSVVAELVNRLGEPALEDLVKGFGSLLLHYNQQDLAQRLADIQVS
jgi:hypothetical protein